MKVDNLDIGDDIRVRDLKLEGVTFLDTASSVVTGVKTTRNTAAAAPAAAAPARRRRRSCCRRTRACQEVISTIEMNGPFREGPFFFIAA